MLGKIDGKEKKRTTKRKVNGLDYVVMDALLDNLKGQVRNRTF